MKIQVEHLGKKIKDAVILDDITLSFESGKIYGLQGKNGSGKTMLMRAVCGVIRPTVGQIIVEGKVLGKDISFPENIGILIENPSFISKYTGYKNLTMIASVQGKISSEDIRESLRKVGLDPDDKRTYRKYSLGMKQRLGIACALMEKPEIILLDEPFNALDEAGIESIGKLILEEKARGAVIILACHDREELERLADDIIVIKDGRVVEQYKCETGEKNDDKA